MTSPLVDRLLGHRGAWNRPIGWTARLIGAIYRALGPLGRPVQGFLNGTWLGHPLHPMLTDVPIGAWTIVLVLDVIALAVPGAGLGPAAAIALWLGVAAALGSIASGATDWKDTYGYEQRVGFVHGLVMLVATLLYVVSGLLRVTGSVEGTGARLVAVVGWIVLVGGGYLGGEMAFAFGSMVDHNAFREGPEEYEAVGPLSALAEGLNLVHVGGDAVLIVSAEGRLCALGDVCSHAGGPLHEGTLTGAYVECPWHGSRFRLADGSVLRGPATFPQPRYDVRVTGGQVEVRRRAM